MSFIEKARERLEEVRAKGLLQGSPGNPGGIVEKARERLEEIRAKGPMAALRETPGGGILGSESGILSNVREKGVLGVLEEKFPRVKEMRERGILGRRTPEPEPKGEVAGEVGEREISLRITKEIHGDAI